jgi:signal transduction histidine kinase
MGKMLKRLRFQLTFLYFLAAVGLVGLIGGSSYILLRLYFQETTDLAMKYKMASYFRVYSVPLSTELEDAEQEWLASNTHPSLIGVPAITSLGGESGESEEEDGGEEDGLEHELHEKLEGDAFDGSVSAIFVIPYNVEGNIILAANQAPLPFFKSEAAIVGALENGYDWRTIRLDDGTRVRLFTYRTGIQGSPAVIQVGRLLVDQDRIIRLFLTGLFVVGVAISILISLASWWLSGRSLLPAQQAWDQQQVFISNASHELRTPLTLIRATADFGLRSKSDDTQKNLLSDIIKESDYMASLVDDLLLLSRLDTQRLKLEKERIQLPKLLSDTHRQVNKLAQERKVEITSDNVQGQIWGDQTRMRQVLLILLDNALRHTPAGGTIQMSAAQQGKFVQIRVADTGSGISAEHLPHVFERFYQAAPSSSDENRSNGLGLSIAKGLIEAQGGKIHMESQLGNGTQVILALPSADGV